MESLHKILYQAYHLLKKVKSAEIVDIFKSVVFSRQKKMKKSGQMSRPTDSRFGLRGHSIGSVRYHMEVDKLVV